jgi:hypothetical protein
VRRIRSAIEPDERGPILMQVALRLAACGEVAHAVALTRELASGSGGDPYRAAGALAIIAPRVAGSALPDMAVLCKNLIAAVPGSATEAAGAVAKALAEAGLVDDAFDVLDSAAAAIARLLARRPDGSRLLTPPSIEGWAGALEAIAQRSSPEKRGRVRDLALLRLSWSSDAETLARLAPHVTPPFPPELVDEALGHGALFPELRLKRVLPWLEALVGPARRDDVVRTAFDSLYRTEADGERVIDVARVFRLGALGPHLTLELVREALRDARSIAGRSGSIDWRALVPLLRRVIELGDAPGALRTIRMVSTDYHAGAGLAAIAPVLPDTLLGDAFRVALKLQRPENRRAALEVLAPRVAQLARADVASLLAAVLANAAQRLRPELLADVAACGPLFVMLGGAALAGRVDDAIVDLGRWWP